MTWFFKRMKKYYAKPHLIADMLLAVIGIGIGIAVSRPVAGEHPIRWGVTCIAIAALGLVWAILQ